MDLYSLISILSSVVGTGAILLFLFERDRNRELREQFKKFQRHASIEVNTILSVKEKRLGNVRMAFFVDGFARYEYAWIPKSVGDGVLAIDCGPEGGYMFVFPNGSIEYKGGQHERIFEGGSGFTDVA